MMPLTAAQGRLLRTIAFSLADDDEDYMDITIESVASVPWSSLTFTGERHDLVVALPPRLNGRPIDGAAIILPRAIVAVEAVEWSDIGGVCRLTATLLTIDAF